MRTSRLPSGPPRKKRKYTNLVIIVIILGIAAYFIGAGAAGGWLAENVIDPVFNSGSSNAADTTDAPSETDAVPDQSAKTAIVPAASGERIEQQISAQKIALYTLQSGAFSSESNASEAAGEIVAQGGAGFVAYDGDLYRVLMAGYLEESDAKDVQTTLEQSGVSTKIFKLDSGTLEFKIGAESEQIQTVKACFDSAPGTVEKLQQIIYNLDKGLTVDDDIGALKASVQKTADDFEQVVETDEGAMQKLRAYMKALNTTVQALPVSSEVSKVEFSSQLKYNLISIVVDYASFLDEIQG